MRWSIFYNSLNAGKRANAWPHSGLNGSITAIKTEESFTRDWSATGLKSWMNFARHFPQGNPFGIKGSGEFIIAAWRSSPVLVSIEVSNAVRYV
jgi:hypothetical protein